MNAGNSQDDARDQIIAVSVLGAVWVLGLCLYLYCAHYPAAVKKESVTVLPVIEASAAPLVIPPDPVSILPAPALTSGEDDSVELSSLHSSELSYANSDEQLQGDDEYSDLISEDRIIFDDYTL